MRYEIRTEEDHIGQITMRSIKFIDQFKDISYNLVLKCNNLFFFLFLFTKANNFLKTAMSMFKQKF